MLRAGSGCGRDRLTRSSPSLPGPRIRTLALGGWQNGALTVRDATTGRRLKEPVNANAGFVMTVAFTPDGSTIVTERHGRDGSTLGTPTR